MDNKKGFTRTRTNFSIKKLNGRGFTLTELMIVVAIIAFLGVLVTGYLRSQVFKGNDAKRKADIKRISIAVEEFEKDNNCYPDSVTCVQNDSLVPYLNEIPCDPVTKEAYAYQTDGGSCPKWYFLYSKLQNVNDTDYTADIGPSSEYSFYQSSPNAPSVGSVMGGGTCNYTGCKSGVCVSVCNESGTPSCSISYAGTNCANIDCSADPEGYECRPM